MSFQCFSGKRPLLCLVGLLHAFPAHAPCSGGAEGLSWLCPLAELAKAKKQRQQTAKQEAIATGMHQLKAIGKGRKGGRGNGKVRPKKLKG